VQRQPALSWLALGACMFLACAPQSQTAPDNGNRAPAPTTPKRLTVALNTEPTIIVMTLIPGANVIARPVRLALHQRIAIYDDRSELRPQLAADLPSQANGTWIVRPDGTMRTVYRLRPGISWHDGTPFTVRDVVFGWKVTNDPELPVSQRGLAPLINRIDEIDDLTFALEWSTTSPVANAIVEEGIGPLPVHLLGEIWATDKDRFEHLPYWTREFIGLGPFQLNAWEPGSYMELRAYDGYYGGRARIDTLVFRFIPNAQTVAANLLAGEIDGEIPPTLGFDEALLVKNEWERAGLKPLAIFQPLRFRLLTAQFRDPRPREVQDVRFRRAMLHAIDRAALVDSLLAGQSQVADTYTPPDDAKWPWIEGAVAKYDYSPARATELLSQMAWHRVGDSMTTTSGENATVSLWASTGADYERIMAIVADDWRKLGFSVDQTQLSRGQQSDNHIRSSFPAFYVSEAIASTDMTLIRYETSNCPTEENRWNGGNWGCYLNGEMDRLTERLNVAIDPAEQQRIYAGITRIQSEELPGLPLYFDVDVTLFRPGVTGVKGDTRPRISATWNVAEWDVL
jgi:peptide/nickel transport system substrate-binding protein